MSKWKTRITEEYGVDLPFIGAGMAFVSTAKMVSAISNAGGMGVFGNGIADPTTLGKVIDNIREKTKKPFGVDLLTRFTTDEHIQVCAAKKVPFVVFFYDVPSKAWVDALHDAKVKVWMQVGSVTEAQAAVSLGVDVLVAQGAEAGGHNKSTASTFSFLPAVIALSGGRPVVAAGGIATGEGVVAAMALGADAVWVGTRLAASEESMAHPKYKQLLVESGVEDSVRTTLFGPEFPGGQIRALRNQVVNQWYGRESEASAPPGTVIGTSLIPTPGGGVTKYEMPAFSALVPTTSTTGDLQEMCLPAGESAAAVKDIKPVAVIIKDMMDEAKRIIRNRLFVMSTGESRE